MTGELKTIIDLQGKIEKEMTTLTKAMEDLADGSNKTFEQIKEALKENIIRIGKQIQELNESMIKHEELKTKLGETEKKLQSMYQLEVQTEISKLNEETEQRNQDLLNSFLSKHSELKTELEHSFSKAKSEIEKSASDRDDEYEVELKKTTTDLKEFQEIFKNQILTFERKIENVYHKIETNHEETTKRADILGKVVIDLFDKVNKHEKDIYKIPLFELSFHRNTSLKVSGASRGIPLLYEINEFDNELKVKTADIFSAFDLKSSSIVDYEGFIKKNHTFNIKTIGNVNGFKIKKSGWYIFELRIDLSNISPHISVDNFYFHADEIIPFSKGNEVNFSLNIKKEFTKNTPFVIYPIINGSDPEFTIKPGSYFKLIYDRENGTLF